jgi:hypothetical protein
MTGPAWKAHLETFAKLAAPTCGSTPLTAPNPRPPEFGHAKAVVGGVKSD